MIWPTSTREATRRAYYNSTDGRATATPSRDCGEAQPPPRCRRAHHAPRRIRSGDVPTGRGRGRPQAALPLRDARRSVREGVPTARRTQRRTHGGGADLTATAPRVVADHV